MPVWETILPTDTSFPSIVANSLKGQLEEMAAPWHNDSGDDYAVTGLRPLNFLSPPASIHLAFRVREKQDRWAAA